MVHHPPSKHRLPSHSSRTTKSTEPLGVLSPRWSRPCPRAGRVTFTGAGQASRRPTFGAGGCRVLIWVAIPRRAVLCPHRIPRPPTCQEMTPAHAAIVTGAGSLRGIGGAGHALATGSLVAVLDTDEASAKDAAEEIAAKHGVRTVGVRCDVTDREQVEAAVSTVESALAPVGALVNNAGITSPPRFLEVSDVERNLRDQRARQLPDDQASRAGDGRTGFRSHRGLAGRGSWTRGSRKPDSRVAKAGLAGRGSRTRLSRKPDSRVAEVNVSSVSAERGGGVFGGVAYSPVKAALPGLSHALARDSVTVSSVAPDLPARRAGAAEDVADVIEFLCRPKSGYVTGATYDINGGSHIHRRQRQRAVVVAGSRR